MRISKEVRVKIYSTENAKILSKLVNMGMNFSCVDVHDDITASFVVSHIDFMKIKEYLESKGIRYEVTGKIGLLWQFFKIVRRPVLLAGCFLLVVFSFILSNRIIFIDVRGNTNIPTRYIAEQAQASGISFGVKRKAINSEETKNQLLEKIPQLQWVGVNTKGCVATVYVAEESDVQEAPAHFNQVGSIVAGTEGVVNDLIVLRGTPLCKVGDHVNIGDTLISGYTDCGLKVQAQVASGEVYAYTSREIAVSYLYPTEKKGEILDVHKCIALKIGKNVINLCNHSGIYSTCCDKMYSEEYWTLPGGYQLPVAMIQKTYVMRESLQPDIKSDAVAQMAESLAAEHLDRQMVSGRVLAKEVSGISCDDFYAFTGLYACEEMIGQLKYEETIDKHAEDN